jgi:hypothetical protein
LAGITGDLSTFVTIGDRISSTASRHRVAPAFRKHAGQQMRKVFSELTPEELRSLEVALKRSVKCAAALMDQRG